VNPLWLASTKNVKILARESVVKAQNVEWLTTTQFAVALEDKQEILSSNVGPHQL
jgi:hypothetical protein